MLRGIFRPKLGEVIVERRELHNEELTDLHTSPNLLEWEKQKECDGRDV